MSLLTILRDLKTRFNLWRYSGERYNYSEQERIRREAKDRL